MRSPPGLELPVSLPVAEPLKVFGVEWMRSLSPLRYGASSDADGDASTTLDELSSCRSEASSDDVGHASPLRLVRTEAGELFATCV